MENKGEISRENLKKIIYVLLVIIMVLLILLVWKIGRIGINATTTSGSISTDGIIVSENEVEIGKNTRLNIFNNQKFNGEKIIAPHSKGSYKFYIKNNSNDNIVYNIKFSDDMKKFVNMKYKLKMDNIYIRGNEDNYVTIDGLDVNNVNVVKDSVNIFTLEWYWEDSDKLDTEVGISDEEYYTINLAIDATKD